MSDSMITVINISELCQQTNVNSDTIFEFVDYGIIEPQGDSPDNWVFDAVVVTRTKCALRLRRDLELDWHGVAVALDLMAQRDRLREENELLRRRLGRFLE